MGKWMDLKGPVVADTVYSDNTLVAKDVSFTLPGLEFMTADVMAMGNMTVPLVGLLENMELTITKIGVDMGLSRLGRLEKQNLEFRWVQNVVKSDGSQGTEGCKAFVRVMPAALPELGVEIGSATEAEGTYPYADLRKRRGIHVRGQTEPDPPCQRQGLHEPDQQPALNMNI